MKLASKRETWIAAQRGRNTAPPYRWPFASKRFWLLLCLLFWVGVGLLIAQLA